MITRQSWRVIILAINPDLTLARSILLGAGRARVASVGDLTELLADWPVDRAAAGVTDAAGTRAVGGDPGWRGRTASVSKLLVGMAALVAVEEGAIELNEPAGPPGATVRHLLAHASGLAFDQDRVLTRPGTRRIYSNVGIERFAEHLAARTGIRFAEYLQQAVLDPLGMADTALTGSPAHDIVSTVDDLLRFARELLSPALIVAETLAEATSAQFPELAGVLPAVGRFDPNPWGLTFELRDGKHPHWTGMRNSAQTFGHFGGSGAFLWVDPVAGLGCVALTDREFGPWALAAWPPFSDAVLAGYPAG
ncbi:MAG: serine hydrolase [Micromonosporaceae bacterium]|nr:serine hydrolase [Micromonosporaceae bacterium]